MLHGDRIHVLTWHLFDLITINLYSLIRSRVFSLFSLSAYMYLCPYAHSDTYKSYISSETKALVKKRSSPLPIIPPDYSYMYMSNVPQHIHSTNWSHQSLTSSQQMMTCCHHHHWCKSKKTKRILWEEHSPHATWQPIRGRLIFYCSWAHPST